MMWEWQFKLVVAVIACMIAGGIGGAAMANESFFEILPNTIDRDAQASYTTSP